MFDFVAIGEVLIDFTPVPGNNPSHAVIFQQNLGGAPANVTCALAKFGRKCSMIAKLGNDMFGEFCKETMCNLSVDTSNLILSDLFNTTLAFVHLSETGDRSFSFYRKNAADVNLNADEVDLALVRSARIFHFGGVSLSHEPVRSATLTGVREAKKSGGVISFDPNIRPALWDNLEEARSVVLDAMQYPDIIKLSEEEAYFLFQSDEHAAVLREIQKTYHTKIIVITRAGKGAVSLINDILTTSYAYDTKTVDTTGSGDCFLAGLLHQFLLLDKPVDDILAQDASDMLAYANAAGSLTCTKVGAVSAIPSVIEIQDCIEHGKLLEF